MKKPLIPKLPMILMIIGYLALQALPTKAQDTLAVSVNEHLAGAQVERLARELSLSESQSKEIYKIFLDRVGLMNKSHGEKQLTNVKTRQINEGTLKKLQAILTTEQKELYAKLSKELAEQKKAEQSREQQSQTLQDKLLEF